MFFLVAILISSFSIYYVLAEVETKKDEKKYIKWVDCNITLEILEKTSKIDIDSHNKEGVVKINWIELIAYLATKYGGNFDSFQQKDLDTIVERLNDGENMQDITNDMKNYAYFYESYDAIFNQFIGEYQIEKDMNGKKEFVSQYGIKVFLPVAKNYGFSHYDDFGAARSYGYKREHLGNDLMGSIGTPIIAIESGIIEACRLESIWWMENRH